jgi:hypothetical protein
MNLTVCGTLCCASLCFASPAHAQEEGKSRHRHHRYKEWLTLLSSGDRAKFKTAKDQALKDPAVAAANQRRKEADAQYRELLQKEILRIDPTLKPMIDALTDLKGHSDY